MKDLAEAILYAATYEQQRMTNRRYTPRQCMVDFFPRALLRYQAKKHRADREIERAVKALSRAQKWCDE